MTIAAAAAAIATISSMSMVLMGVEWSFLRGNMEGYGTQFCLYQFL
jgi:hypothetical protein